MATHPRLDEDQAAAAAEELDALDALLELLEDAVFVLVQGEIARCNAGSLELLGARSEAELCGRPLLTLAPSARQDELRAALQGASRHACLQTRLGPVEVEVRAKPCRWRGLAAELVVCRDASPVRRTREKLTESLLRMDVLERMAAQADLSEVLLAVVSFVERIQADLFVGIWVYDTPEQDAISLLAAPWMPEESRLICQSVNMAHDQGPVATCLRAGARVLTRDPAEISADPDRLRRLWDLGVRALWCEPILSAARAVLGAVVVYYLHPRLPEPWDLDFIRSAAHLAAIAVERRRTEEALRVSEARFRTLFDNAPEAIVVVDLDARRFVSCNPRAEVLAGMTREALLQQRPLDMSPLMQPDGLTTREVMRSIDARLRSGEVVEMIWVLRDAFGREVPCAVTIVRLPEPGRALVRATLVDLSEQQRIERERAALEVELRHRQRLSALGTLAGTVAHEINNPIQGIMGYAELIGLRAGDDAVVSRYAAEIVRESDRAATIVRSLLAFARREQDQPMQPQDVNAVVRSTLPLLVTLLSRDAIALDFLPDPAPLAIAARGAQLRQVVLNLVSNARDAINALPESDSERRVTISTGLRHDDDGRRWAWLAVQDTGVGISEAAQARIFEPFFTTKPTEHSTGMGLAISGGIVAEHGGRLYVTSPPGCGARFALDLPAVDDPARDVE